MIIVVADQTDWGKLRVAGADRVRFLQGMLSNDVAVLPVGGWARSVLLNPKGRVLAIVDAVNEGESFLLATEPATARKLEEVLQKHAIMDDVTFTPEERAMHRVWPTPESVWTTPPVFAQPAGPALLEDVEARRIEAGLPRYHADVSEEYFPFEANLDSAISYTKGCYIGQEVVARANARGHANKRLVGLRLEGDGPIAAGTKLSTESRPDAGTVTSSIISPSFGPIALGYVHKSAWDPGTRLRAGERAAIVSELPFR